MTKKKITFNTDQEWAIEHFLKSLQRLSSVGLRVVGGEDSLLILTVEQLRSVDGGPNFSGDQTIRSNAYVGNSKNGE